MTSLPVPGPRCGGQGDPFVRRGLRVGHRQREDKGGPAHPDVRHGIVSSALAVLQLDAGHTDLGGLRAGAGIPGMHYYLGRRVLGRAEEQMAVAFNARRPPARGPGEHLQPVPFAHGGLSP